MKSSTHSIPPKLKLGKVLGSPGRRGRRGQRGQCGSVSLGGTRSRCTWESGCLVRAQTWLCSLHHAPAIPCLPSSRPRTDGPTSYSRNSIKRTVTAATCLTYPQHTMTLPHDYATSDTSPPGNTYSNSFESTLYQSSTTHRHPRPGTTTDPPLTPTKTHTQRSPCLLPMRV